MPELALPAAPIAVIDDDLDSQQILRTMLEAAGYQVQCILDSGAALAELQAIAPALIILDLNEHSFEKARELYADVWLGFKESALHGFLKKAGFAKVEVTTVAKETSEPFFETLLASGVKAGK